MTVGLTFTSTNGQQVEITQPTGANNVLFLYVDRYYYGQINKVGGKWVAFLNQNELDSGDISAILERVESAFPPTTP